MKSFTQSWRTVVMLTALISAACGSSNSSKNDSLNNDGGNAPDNNQVIKNNTNTDTNANDSSQSEAETGQAPALAPLPPEPQEIGLEISGGRVLEALYYPAATNPAPVVILLHMAGANKDDWRTIAPWLQNRGQEIPEGFRTWQDATWFPTLPNDVSFGVFVFTFGGFDGNPGGDWHDFPLEALTALQTVSTLEGVNPDQITTMGTSIGADSSASSCYQFNLLVSQGNAEGTCRGSFSLSPGNYLLGGDHLSETYEEIVAGQQSFPFPVTIYCLAAENDSNSPATCLGAQQDTVSNYFPYIFSGRDHGMYLIKEDAIPNKPESEKNTLELYMQFLNTVYGLDIGS